MNAKLMERLASMEKELATFRARKPEEKSFDPQAFRSAFVADPLGSMTKMGVPVDYITKVLVAHAMGDQAPAELRMLAQQGPMVSAQNALESRLEQLSRQVSTIVETGSKKSVQESFKALSADKTKYPHLAKAVQADASLFDGELSGHGGTAEEFATQAEARLSKIAAIYVPPTASEANADKPDQSMQVKPATSASLPGGVPPLPVDKAGVFTNEDHAKLREEVVRKYASS